MTIARAERRKQFDDHTRMTLAEDDLDRFEAAMTRQDGKLDSIRNLLFASLITFCTSAVLLAMNIVLERQ